MALASFSLQSFNELWPYAKGELASTSLKTSVKITCMTRSKSTDSKLVRPADFLSIKFRLESEGLISGDAIADLN